MHPGRLPRISRLSCRAGRALVSHIVTKKGFNMKTLACIGLVAFVSATAFAGDCGKCCDAKKASQDKTTATCPVSRAKQQAKASAGSTKEHAKASKAALKIGSY